MPGTASTNVFLKTSAKCIAPKTIGTNPAIKPSPIRKRSAIKRATRLGAVETRLSLGWLDRGRVHCGGHKQESPGHFHDYFAIEDFAIEHGTPPMGRKVFKPSQTVPSRTSLPDCPCVSSRAIVRCFAKVHVANVTRLSGFYFRQVDCPSKAPRLLNLSYDTFGAK